MSSSGARMTFTPPARARSHSPRAQAVAGQVHGDQGGRAGGVDRQARRRAGRERSESRPAAVLWARAGAEVGVDRRRRPRRPSELRVVAAADADEDAGLRAVRGGRAAWPASSSASQATSSSRRCCGSMLGGLARGDAEEVRVEAVELSEEAAVAAVPSCRGRRGPGRRSVGVPAVGRHLADRVAAVAQQLPEARGWEPRGKRQPMPTTATGSCGALAGPRYPS